MKEAELRQLARDTFLTETNTYGCAETALVVLKQAYHLPEPADSTMAMALNGGVGWWGNVCGAVSGAALAVGMLAGQRIAGHRRAKRIARRLISRLMAEFEQEFGTIQCSELIQLDIRQPEQHAQFITSGVWRDTCMRQIEFVISRLHALQDETVWQETLRELEKES